MECRGKTHMRRATGREDGGNRKGRKGVIRDEEHVKGRSGRR